MKAPSFLSNSVLTLTLTLTLASCIDTTGISAESSRQPAGNAGAAVLVEEFADFQCPACKAANETIVHPLLEKYGTQIRYEFQHFPLRSLHRYAMDLAEAAECSADQNKFWEFVDMAFDRQEQLKKGVIADWAEDLTLDMDLFDRCTRSHIKRDAIQANYDAGVARGVGGTPTFFVNGQKVTSSLAEISTAIDTALATTMQRL